jgi:hypothetical protein
MPYEVLAWSPWPGLLLLGIVIGRDLAPEGGSLPWRAGVTGSMTQASDGLLPERTTYPVLCGHDAEHDGVQTEQAGIVVAERTRGRATTHH